MTQANDPLSGASDHLAGRTGSASSQSGEPPSTPTKPGGAWAPRWLQRRAAHVADKIGATKPSCDGSKTSERTTHDEKAAPAPAGEPSESFKREKKQRLLVPKALRTLDDDKRSYKSRELSESLVWTTMKSFVVYCLFLLVFTIVAFSTRTSSDYWANEGMRQLFVDGPFFFDPQITHEKTLHDIHFVPQLYAWLEGPFLERIHTPELGSPPRYLHGCAPKLVLSGSYLRQRTRAPVARGRRLW